MVVGTYPWARDLHKSIYAFENLNTLLSYLCQGYHLDLLVQLLKLLFQFECSYVSKLAFLQAYDYAYLLRIKSLIDGQYSFLLHALSKFIYFSIFFKIWVEHERRFFSRQSHASRMKHALS
jgi:hypothetical protein